MFTYRQDEIGSIKHALFCFVEKVIYEPQHSKNLENIVLLQVQLKTRNRIKICQRLSLIVNQMPNLKKLCFMCPDGIVHSQVIDILTRFRNLQQLKINFSKSIAQRGIQVVSRMNKLKVIDLRESNLKGVANLSKLLGSPNNLTQLDLTNTSLSDRELQRTNSRVIFLKSLHLSQNNLTTEGILSISLTLRWVQHLTIHSCNIEDEALLAISLCVHNITTLNISKNSITEQGIQSLVKRHPKIKKLIVDQNNLGSRGGYLIASRLKQLQTLSAKNCKIAGNVMYMYLSKLVNIEQYQIDGNMPSAIGLIRLHKNKKQHQKIKNLAIQLKSASKFLQRNIFIQTYKPRKRSIWSQSYSGVYGYY